MNLLLRHHGMPAGMSGLMLLIALRFFLKMVLTLALAAALAVGLFVVLGGRSTLVQAVSRFPL